jgi:hypothetical protein
VSTKLYSALHPCFRSIYPRKCFERAAENFLCFRSEQESRVCEDLSNHGKVTIVETRSVFHKTAEKIKHAVHVIDHLDRNVTTRYCHAPKQCGMSS